MTHVLTANEIKALPDGALVDVIEKRWYGPRGGKFWYGNTRTKVKQGNKLLDLPTCSIYLLINDYPCYEFRTHSSGESEARS